ncbi:YceD family protein [Castellaniella sp.]|uniref:YceD family protein n=1 Tax=Castellaniella sp. TaxID=1955812 RepID=UPI0039C8A325
MVIDAQAFTSASGALSGHLFALSCVRLCQGLPENQPGGFEWQLDGRVDAGRGYRRWLDVRAQGVVRVVCQRCLSPFDLTLHVDTTLGLLDNAAQLEAMDALEAEGRGSDVEYLVADALLDVESLVEDELILALPVAPHHETCPDAEGGHEGPDDRDPSPFAALAQLRTQLKTQPKKH